MTERITSSMVKVPAGKLLRVKLRHDEKSGKIINIKITGDFFVYPEEAVEEFERSLAGAKFEDVGRMVKEFFNKTEEVFGLDETSMVEAIMQCRQKKQD